MNSASKLSFTTLTRDECPCDKEFNPLVPKSKCDSLVASCLNRFV